MISVNEFHGKPIAIMGLGKSGLAAARSLTSGGAIVWAWDDTQAQRKEAQANGINLVDLYECDWSTVEYLVLSPGIPDKHPQPHLVAAKAHHHNCQIICDIDLLARSTNEASIVGITGTNGKSSTTALLGHILGKASLEHQIGGNFGIPVLELETMNADGTYVFELSSFQLDRTPSLKLDIAVLLNISPDHLDRYDGMEGYVESKKAIFDKLSLTGTAIVSIDDAACRGISLEMLLDDVNEQNNIVPVSVKSRCPGGVYLDGSVLIDDINNERADVFDLESAIHLSGIHNWQNIIAAYSAARILNLDADTVANAIPSFTGLPHRQEVIRTIGRVKYVNDSKATNIDSVLRALSSYESIYWIAGGVLKQPSIGNLSQSLDHVKAAYLIGEAASYLAKELGENIKVTQSNDLQSAVLNAHEDAQQDENGATVLLSPGCSSFDQFVDFEERGSKFREIVGELE